MFAIKSRTELVIRIFTIVVIIFNAIVPTAVLAAGESLSDKSLSSKTIANSSQALPKQKPLFYTPPVISPAQDTSPNPDTPPSPIPSKDPVEFTVVSDPAIIPANGIVTFQVSIWNHSAQALTALTFVDRLEAGMEFNNPDGTSTLLT